MVPIPLTADVVTSSSLVPSLAPTPNGVLEVIAEVNSNFEVQAVRPVWTVQFICPLLSGPLIRGGAFQVTSLVGDGLYVL
jgi:hypothetical protein